MNVFSKGRKVGGNNSNDDGGNILALNTPANVLYMHCLISSSKQLWGKYILIPILPHEDSEKEFRYLRCATQ